MKQPSWFVLAVAALAGGGLLGCSSSSGGETPSPGAHTDAGASDVFVPTAATFDCLKGSEWTQVGIAMYKNVLGHDAEMLAVARSDDGGVFPEGTVIQLVPTEASVKRFAGFSAASHDWEFFSLSSSSSGATTIVKRGGTAAVVNMFGGSCLNCHGTAAPQWDLVCESNDGGIAVPDSGLTPHGCAQLPSILTPDLIVQVRAADSRCK
jgi:hypothetical protein